MKKVVLLFLIFPSILVSQNRNQQVHSIDDVIQSQKDSLYYLKHDLTLITGSIFGPCGLRVESIINGEINTGLVFEYYSDCVVKSVKKFKNGLLNKSQYEYYNNGYLKSDISYYNGVINGKYRVWYSNNFKDIKKKYKYYKNYRSDGTMKIGILYDIMMTDSLNEVGKSENFYIGKENGQLMLSENYTSGLKDGESRSWYENGQLKSRKKFTLGKMINQECWDKDLSPIKCLY